MAGMERFTQRARRVLSLAHQEAERMRHTVINTEHILLDHRGGSGIAGHACANWAGDRPLQEMWAPCPSGVESPAWNFRRRAAGVGIRQREARLLAQFVGTNNC